MFCNIFCLFPVDLFKLCLELCELVSIGTTFFEFFDGGLEV